VIRIGKSWSLSSERRLRHDGLARRDLRGTLRRLLARLWPERVRLVIVLFLGVTSVGFPVTGPRILGDATNVLFNGIISKQLPAGLTKAQAIAALRAHGQGQLADIISGMTSPPAPRLSLPGSNPSPLVPVTAC
jgi:hypothetical protein